MRSEDRVGEAFDLKGDGMGRRRSRDGRGGAEVDGGDGMGEDVDGSMNGREAENTKKVFIRDENEAVEGAK